MYAFWALNFTPTPRVDSRRTPSPTDTHHLVDPGSILPHYMTRKKFTEASPSITLISSIQIHATCAKLLIYQELSSTSHDVEGISGYYPRMVLLAIQRHTNVLSSLWANQFRINLHTKYLDFKCHLDLNSRSIVILRREQWVYLFAVDRTLSTPQLIVIRGGLVSAIVHL